MAAEVSQLRAGDGSRCPQNRKVSSAVSLDVKRCVKALGEL